MTIIYLSPSDETLVCKVSPEDYQFLIKWKWSYKRSEPKYHYAVYAKRSKSIYKAGSREKTVSIYLHHIILQRMGLVRPTKKHTADHINNDSLDNRRGNLRWATKRQQSRNQRRYK